jgi:hypothetical protein
VQPVPVGRFLQDRLEQVRKGFVRSRARYTLERLATARAIRQV